MERRGDSRLRCAEERGILAQGTNAQRRSKHHNAQRRSKHRKRITLASANTAQPTEFLVISQAIKVSARNNTRV